jgi:hypothetical protein
LAAPKKSLGGIIDVIKFADQNEDLIRGIVSFIKGLFGKGKPKPPSEPVKEPTPVAGPQDDDFPDDVIPAPPQKGRKVTTVALHLTRAQYNRQRFPEKYTDDNPFGLYSQDYLKQVEAGNEAINWGSKFWLDLTARDAEGKEFLRDAIVAGGLAFKTEHHCGDAYIIGGGVFPDGGNKDYKTNDTAEIGNGISAWLSSNGFLHQMKAHGEGAFECWGKVGGVESNHFTLKVS